MSIASRARYEVWALTGVLLVGAALRFATITSQSYWYDEAQAARELHLPFGALLSSLNAHETAPPLYFVAGWLWAKVLGTGELGLRSLSALAGIAAIALAYLCGRELVSRRAGLVAAGLTTLNPFMIWYSQEAREYMLLAALCGASLLYFGRALRDPSARSLGWWALFSALALLTHFFAGFLVGPEAIWLLYVTRGHRATVLAVGAVALVQVALLPLLFTHGSASLLGFIKATPLSIRLEQVPVAFGLGTLYQSSLVSWGLLGAAALAAALVALLVIGAEPRQLRGAGVAAAIAAVVLLAPLLIALSGHDFYIPRALIPAWIPLAVVVGAACTAPRARLPGAALATILLAGFVWAQIRIEGSPQYQRPNWRGVASALANATGTRAIVVYDGALATDPLATYLPRVSFTQPSQAPVSVSELDIVGSRWQQPASRLPAGTALIGSKVIDDFLVARYSLQAPRKLSPAALSARAQTLLAPASDPAVLVQRTSR